MEIDVPQSQNQPLETEMGTLQRLLHLLNAQHEHGGAHGHDDGDGECRRKAPVAVFTGLFLVRQHVDVERLVDG